MSLLNKILSFMTFDHLLHDKQAKTRAFNRSCFGRKKGYENTFLSFWRHPLILEFVS